jgi:hypothetical protein
MEVLDSRAERVLFKTFWEVRGKEEIEGWGRQEKENEKERFGGTRELGESGIRFVWLIRRVLVCQLCV